MSTAPTPTVRRHAHVSLLPGRAWAFGILAFAWYATTESPARTPVVVGLAGRIWTGAERRRDLPVRDVAVPEHDGCPLRRSTPSVRLASSFPGRGRSPNVGRDSGEVMKAPVGRPHRRARGQRDVRPYRIGPPQPGQPDTSELEPASGRRSRLFASRDK